MKATALFILFSLMANFSNSQEYHTVKKSITVLQQQNHYLNGGMRASIAGKSRVTIPITLPQNTVEWYYSFSTTINEQGKKNLELAIGLAKYFGPTGIAAAGAVALVAPPGEAATNVYILDGNNTTLFMQKVPFRYYVTGSRESFKSGVVPINDIRQGTWYIGIQNPASLDGVNVFIEVVAIVEERVRNEKADEETKARLYSNMGWQAFLKKDYDKCIDLCKKALSYEADDPFAKCNLALCYLVQNKSEYIDAYIDAIATCKKRNDSESILRAALKDIEDQIRELGSLKNAEEIVMLIKNELHPH